MNIKVKFPNGHYLNFQCPQHWTTEQIRYFSAKNQSFYDPDAIKLYYDGVELIGNEKFIHITKKKYEQIVFLIGLTTQVQTQQPNKQLIYLEYTKNIQTIQFINSNYPTNFQPIMSYMPIMGLKFQSNNQPKNFKVQQQRIQDDTDSPIQQEIFFHFKMIYYIGAFYTLFSSYFKGQNYYYLLIIIETYYWIKYQEFKGQLRRQQQLIQRQQQQRDLNQNQEQYQQQQQQIIRLCQILYLRINIVQKQNQNNSSKQNKQKFKQ
ncbi:unnamed protein product [Paramecium sonneborni]|uniref:Ubiquitin-like domain-containing protein n=1 Tax=Paramecium sonneborni TaxID=65129 RepID=A0A8S1QX59_9CILI|nr:unnamed protein product [Paramecium sonneborni]